jgi:hypothetical protein
MGISTDLGFAAFVAVILGLESGWTSAWTVQWLGLFLSPSQGEQP